MLKSRFRTLTVCNQLFNFTAEIRIFDNLNVTCKNFCLLFNGNQYNAKSLLNIIAACIKCGSEIEVVCDGADENEALAEAVQLIESGLGE